MKKAPILFALLLFAMPAPLAQNYNNGIICSDSARCDPIGDSVRMVLGETHPPVQVLPPARWSSRRTADINTQRAREINAHAYAIVERGKITDIMMSVEAFQATILIFGPHERTEKRFGMDIAMQSLCEVRGFLHGWEAARTATFSAKKHHRPDYLKTFQCGS